MNIVNFTPVSAFTGGLIIGLAVVLFFVLNGRSIGISGIASNFLTSKNNRMDNLLFLIGLIIGPIIYKLIDTVNTHCPVLDILSKGVPIKLFQKVSPSSNNAVQTKQRASAA